MKIVPRTKLGKVFLAVVIIVFLAFFASLAWDLYGQYKGEKDVEQLANELKKWRESEYQKKADDKIGGKTPQETLELFISAVEKGDYELASKYFVIEEQAKWKNDLSTAKNTDVLLEEVIKAGDSKGEYSFDQKGYSIYEPILVSFILYPSGNWKIEKI